MNSSLSARLAKITVVLTDVDGTLFRAPTDALEHVARHIRKLSRVGTRFSVATGRAIAGVQAVVSRLEAEHGAWTARRWTMPVIAYNGAVVAIPSEPVVLDRLVISQHAVAIAVSTATGHGCSAFIYACRQPFDLFCAETVYGYTDTPYRPASEFNGMRVAWNELEHLASDDIVAILVADPAATGKLPDIAAALELRQLGLRVTTSGGPYLEISSITNSKLRGMKTLAHRLECELDEIMAVGDNLNDLEMLEHAGVSVAVANAPDAVKRRSSYVSAHSAGEGVVDALRLLLEQRRVTIRSRRLVGEPNVRLRR